MWVFFIKPVSFFSGSDTVISMFSTFPIWVLSVGLHFFESDVIIPYSLSDPLTATVALLFLFCAGAGAFIVLLFLLLSLAVLVVLGFVPILLFTLLFCVVGCGFLFWVLTSLDFCVFICDFVCSVFCFTGWFFVLFDGITSNIDIFLVYFFSFFPGTGSDFGSGCFCWVSIFCWGDCGFEKELWFLVWGSSSTSPPFNLINSFTTICKSCIDQTATSAPSSPFLSIKNWTNWPVSYPLSKIFSLKKFCFSSIVASSLIFIINFFGN